MEENASFVRQRRNLIAVSLLLLIAQQTEISISEVKLLGNVFKLPTEYRIASILWIPAIYWAIRYYQALRDLGNLGFRNKVEGHLNRVLLPERAFKRYLETEERPKDLSSAARASYSEPGVNPTPYSYAVKLRIHWVESGRDVVGDHSILLSRQEVRWPIVRGWIHLLVHTSLFTEYVLPPILFLLAAGQWAWPHVVGLFYT